MQYIQRVLVGDNERLGIILKVLCGAGNLIPLKHRVLFSVWICVFVFVFWGVCYCMCVCSFLFCLIYAFSSICVWVWYRLRFLFSLRFALVLFIDASRCGFYIGLDFDCFLFIPLVLFSFSLLSFFPDYFTFPFLFQ